MSSFWYAVLHVMLRLKLLKPYLAFIDYLIDKTTGG
jgi:hypothetical protein